MSANGLKELLSEAPDSLLEVARAKVHLGDLNAALRELEQFVRMGQSTDLLETSSDFAALLKTENFAEIRNGMKANRSAISRGSTAFLLSDPGLLAEDVDYDPGTKRFFITSVREKKLISTEASGGSADFAKAPDDWPMLAVKVDRPRGVVWATEVAMLGFNFAPESDWGRSAVLCYDLKNGKLQRRIEGLRGTALGDMALTANGDVIVSDGDGGACTGYSRRAPYWNVWTAGTSSPLKLRRCIQTGNTSSCLTMLAGLVCWRLQRSRYAGFRREEGLPSTALTGCISIARD